MSLAARVTQPLDAGESRRMLPPLTGVKTTPLLPLEDAVAGLRVIEEHANVDDEVFVAVAHAEEKLRTESDHPMDAQQMASLILYTLETQVYPRLNRVLRDANRELVKPYFPYIRVLLEALSKLPPHVGTVCRGMKIRLPADDYPVGRKFFWWAFTSCTLNESLLNDPQFCGTTGDRTIFVIKTSSGRNITRYSMMPGEDEVLLPCGLQFEVAHRFTVPGTHCDVINIEEVSSRVVPWSVATSSPIVPPPTVPTPVVPTPVVSTPAVPNPTVPTPTTTSLVVPTKRIATLKGHTSNVRALAWRSDGVLASGSEEIKL